MVLEKTNVWIVLGAALWLSGCAGDSDVGQSSAIDTVDGAPRVDGSGGHSASSTGGAGVAAASGASGGGGIRATGGVLSAGGAGGLDASAGGAGSGGGGHTSDGATSTGGAGSGGVSGAGGAGGRDAGSKGGGPPDASTDGASLHDAAADGANVCDGGVPLPFGHGKKRMFETRQRFNGNLVAAVGDGAVIGGLAAGDALCNRAAGDAGLGGTWTAWLSDSTVNAIDRIQGDGPWYRLDGALVFPDKAALAGNPLVELFVTENCTISDLAVWTGTLANGTKSPNTCDDWTSSAADVHGLCGYANTLTSNKWSEGTTPLCYGAYNLYCFEQ